MTAIDVRFIDGLAIAPEDGVETHLAAHPAFAAAWALVKASAPLATLTPLFTGESDELAAEIQDLTDAARMTGADPPDLLRWFWLECPDDLVGVVLPLVEALPFVEWAGPRPLVVPASQRDGNVSWGTNPEAQHAFQIRRAPQGVDAIHAWRIEGGTGAGVTIADVEAGWYLDHEELLTARITRHSVFGDPSEASRQHGTFVAGVLVAADNGVGVVGITPDADLKLVTNRRSATHISPAEAITAAARAVGPGGVVLLEGTIHLGPFPPPGTPASPDLLLEANPANHAAIRHATETLRAIVVEPAGNGFENVDPPLDLDSPPPVPEGTTQKVDMELPTASPSGAIVVGAGENVEDGRHWITAHFSVRGSRVDCFAAGDGVLAPAGPDASSYGRFGGTSAAGAIVAGVAAAIQGMSLAESGRALRPEQVRNLVRDRALGTRTETGFGGVGSMPDLRRIARAQGWVRILPVSAAIRAGQMVVAVVDDDDRLERRHWTTRDGWSPPLPPPADDIVLWPAPAAVLSWTQPGAEPAWLALAADVFGIHRLGWGQGGVTSGFEPPVTLRHAADLASGSPIAAARIGQSFVVIVMVGKSGHLLALAGDLGSPDSRIDSPVIVDPVGSYRRSDGVAIAAVGDGTTDVVAIEDGGSLNWYRRQSLPAVGDFWSASIVEPTLTPFVPGARPAALVIGGRIMAAAVGVQGWLTVVEIDPTLGTTPLAFAPPVVVDTARTIAARGPLALAQLQTPDGEQLFVFALSTEGDLLFATRPAAGGDWSPLSALPSVRRLSPLGGVTAVSSPDLGVVVFAVAVDGTVVTARSRTGATWTRLHSFAESEPPPAPVDPKALISNAFKDDAILQSVAADEDRISRLRHARTDAVGKLQRALLLWDPDCLPNHHDDGKYGDETAGAVARFKSDVLLVPPAHIVDDVGPATVLALDKIQAAAEG